MLAILFQEKTKKMLVFPKNAEKNASIIEKGLSGPALRYTYTVICIANWKILKTLVQLILNSTNQDLEMFTNG